MTTEVLRCNSSCSNPPKITSFNATSTEIRAGDTVYFDWQTSGCIDGWSLKVGDSTYSGDDPRAWSALDSDYNLMEPKTYKAVLDVLSECCQGDEKSIDITVLPPPSPTCPATFFSSVNVATGSLLQSEPLFATKSGSPATAIILTYDSLDSRVGPLGAKWSHSYDIALTDNDVSATVREGNRRSLYMLTGGAYVPEAGDYSMLVKTADQTFTLTYKDGTKKKFNLSGKISEIVDGNGNSLTFVYDTSGNLASITDAAARSTTFSYNSNNRITSITDPSGKEYTFTYGVMGVVPNIDILEKVTWPDGSIWQYSYSGKGVMQSKTDPLGKVTTYNYDATNRVIQGTSPAGKTKAVLYSGGSSLKSSSLADADGGVWTYTYDYHKGLLTVKTDPLGKSTTYTYDAGRNLTRETAPDGSFTNYTYDGAGNRLSMTDALGNTTTYIYNGLGQVTSSTDPLGRVSSSTYDDKGRLTETADPLGAKTTYAYDTKGNLTSVTNALSQTSTFTYDAAGNQTSSTDPSGATTTIIYDAMGNLLTQTDALGKLTAYEYDARYRIVKVTDPLGNVTSFTYDLKGNKTSQTDANGNVTRYEYDDQDHLVKTIDALGNATSYTYGANGCTSCGGGSDKLTGLTDAKGQTTSYQYDLLSRLTKETDPLGMATSYLYDAVGNLISKTDANGATITYAYNAVNRLTAKSYPDGSSESFTYDAVGRILTAKNASVAYTYAYDAAGRVTSVIDSRGYTIAYSYDLLGNRSRMTFQPGAADERITSYAYDGAGRLTGITSGAGTFTYGYDTLGRRKSLSYPNQIIATYSYDSAGRLTSLSHGSVASFAYTHDKVGNRTSKTFTETEQYFYDTIYRLLTVVSSKLEAFSFDPVGNRLTGPGAKDTAYLHNSGSQMTQGRKLRYGYDNNGNQTSRSVPAASDKSWTQTWDFENRLVKVEKVKGAEKKIVSFTYDPRGRRIGKHVAMVINGVTKALIYGYVYDNDNIILERLIDGSTTTNAFFTHGAGVDEHLTNERDGEFSYYHADGLGSVVTLTDKNKRVMQSYEYDSFGRAKPFSTSFINSYTYTGREWEKESGLYYYRARYYDPMEGRFISKDQIGLKGGINLHNYVDSNPVNRIDPTGEAWNGNVTGSFYPQDNKCSVSTSFDFLNNNKCTKQCCKEHDDCYAKYGCNASSWIINCITSIPVGACQMCNLKAAACILSNVSNDKCDYCKK